MHAAKHLLPKQKDTMLKAVHEATADLKRCVYTSFNKSICGVCSTYLRKFTIYVKCSKTGKILQNEIKYLPKAFFVILLFSHFLKIETCYKKPINKAVMTLI